MPRRVFNKLVSNHRKGELRWYLKPFRGLLAEHGLWSTHRRRVVPAFGVGVFVGLLPLPGHVIFGALAALYFRFNLPVAIVATLVTNPLTVGPLLYLDYRVGMFVLGAPPEPLDVAFSLEWLGGQFVEVWKPMMLGSVIVAPIGGLIAYSVLNVVWRVSTGLRYRRRRRADQRET